MTLSRRQFAASVAVFVGGCAESAPGPTRTPSSDRDGDGVPDRGDDYPTDDDRAYRSFSMEGTPTLAPGEFSAIALTNSPRARGSVLHYDVTVVSDVGVDCLVFERDAYDAFEAGSRDVSTVSRYSRVDVTEAAVTERLDRGEYVFALDHTDLLTDPGPEPVDVRLRVELADPSERSTT